MSGSDQQKLVNAGFTIIRIDEQPTLRIKFKGNGGHEWKTLEKGFASRAAVERRVKELLTDAKTIQD
jgi:hypothetical protein